MMKNPVKKRCRPNGFRFSRMQVFLSIFMTLAFQISVAKAVDTEAISKKMEQVQLQREKASKKLLQAYQTQQYLDRQIHELKEEVMAIKNEKQIAAYSVAVRFGRIRYNLQLLGLLGSYGEILKERIDTLKTAHAELGYMHQRLWDDLKMHETVSNTVTAEQLENVGKVIEKHAWLNAPFLFTTQGLPEPDPKAVWKDMISAK